jgi:hypothetical protein
MKLRVLRQWPALFVAVLAFVAGPMAYGADERSITTCVAGALDDESVGRELLGTLGEVSALCREASVRAGGGHPDARGFRELAQAIDAVVARAMDKSGEATAPERRALAGVVLAAEAMRSADNRVRKAALAGLASARAMRLRPQRSEVA